MPPPNDRVLVARIGAAHGIKGEVRVASFTADPMGLTAYAPLTSPDGRVFKVTAARPVGSSPTTLIVRFEGVPDRNAAETLNGIELSVPRSALGETATDEFFHADLIGLAAVTTDGAPLGTVVAVQNYGAGDLIEVAPARGNTILIPFTSAAVPEIDVAGGRVVVDPPPGIMGRAPVTWRATILTLFPGMFPGPLGESLAGRGLADGIWSIEARNIREFATDRHRTVDDTPAGGGPGMVMRADVLATAIDAASSDGDPRPRLLMSARGKKLDQTLIADLAIRPGVLIVAGRFEGVDERVIEGRNLIEVSVGDYVLSGGEVAAMAVLDAVVRLLPGVMGNADSGASESFVGGLLEYPQYTKPAVWEGRPIPPVLLSGDHAKIAAWRRREALRLTVARRPDLLSTTPRD